MKSASRDPQAKSALELIEEAIHLLRAAPAAALAYYYVGTLPFILGLLYFWADMSRSAFALQHLAESALGLTLLFLWMKCCQAMFVRRLRASFGGLPRLTFARCGRLCIAQVALQPTGLFLLPLALVPVFTFGWAYSFYQDVTVLADGEPEPLRRLISRAGRQSSLWYKQNLSLLAIFAGFGLFVFLNWTTVGLALPALVKMIFGLESMFTRAGFGAVNTTFFAVMLGLTYACVDPILKIVYALRCFYGESLRSGADLRFELKQQASPLGVAACLLLFMALGTAAATRQGTSPNPELAEARVQNTPAENASVKATPVLVAPELDRAIEHTIQQRKYTWRMPRDKLIEPEYDDYGAVRRFFARVGDTLERWVEAVGKWLNRWLGRLFRGRRTGPISFGSGWVTWLEALLYFLLAAAFGALILLLVRHWRGRKVRATLLAAQPLQAAPDLHADDLSAEQLPEDGWTRLARELLAKGELRLAIRAFYLASLAHLASRNLISLAKFKSNREYERELRRRGHAFPQLLAPFGENVRVFDSTWYGLHEVDAGLVNEFAANVERLRGEPSPGSVPVLGHSHA